MNATVRHVPPPPPPGTRPPYLVEREAHILKRIGYYQRSLSLAQDDDDADRQKTVHAHLAGLFAELARVRVPMPEPGHDGRPQEFHEPVDRLEYERERIEAINMNVDQLEVLAHMDEKFEVLSRLAARKDSKREPLISHDQWQAGRKLQHDWWVYAKSNGTLTGAVGGGSGAASIADAKCDALDRYKRAMRYVGASNERILTAIVIDDRDLADVAVHLCGYSRAAVKAKNAQKAVVLLLRAALDSLVAFYGVKPKRAKTGITREHPYHPFHGER